MGWVPPSPLEAYFPSLFGHFLCRLGANLVLSLGIQQDQAISGRRNPDKFESATGYRKVPRMFSNAKCLLQLGLLTWAKMRDTVRLQMRASSER
jgi:hypothetical protein